MSQNHFPIQPSRSTGDSESIASQGRKLPPLNMMASDAVSPNTYISQSRHSNSKPPILPPTSVSSLSRQLYVPFKTKPPPVPKKRTKSTANYDRVVTKFGSVSTPSSVPYSVMDLKPTAECSPAPAGGSDDYYQDPDKISPVKCEVFSLVEFVSLYKHSLPLRVRVKQGFCGKDERSVISSGDVYNFHFIKNETVLSIEDKYQKAFSVPLNSSLKFGILYDSQNGDKAASLGALSYKTISNLASCCIPPLVVKALQNFSSSETTSSVEAEEVLIIKEVIHTPYNKLYVKAFSLHTHKLKILYEDCKGCFLTDPSCVQLYATEIVEHLKDSLPLKAMLFLDYDASDTTLPGLMSEVVTLKHTDVESSIIATTCWDENDAIPDLATDHDDLVPVAIPTSLKISLTVLQDQSENESLYENTRQLYETFDLSKVYAVSSSVDNSDNCYTALKYSIQPRSGHDYQGLNIIKPSKIYGHDDSFSSSSNTAKCQTPQTLQSQHKSPSSKLPTSHIGEQNQKSKLESDIEELKSELKQAWSVINDLAAKCDRLQKEVAQLKNNAAGNATGKQVVIAKEKIVTMERNVKELRTLNCTQIQGLLQTMNLTQYLKPFCADEIDGQLLSECDEEILQHELGISSVIHRAKLMKIITGRQSAVDILKGRIQAK